MAKIVFPAESALRARLADASFHDAFETDLRDAATTPVDIALRAMTTTPEWVGTLLALRDRMVGPLGVKTVGRLAPPSGRAAASYAVGDPLGAFRVCSIGEDELVLGIDDSHLDVRVSFLKRRSDRRSTYAVCSVVKTHNLLGRLYMLPVGRIHPLVVRTMMRHAAV